MKLSNQTTGNAGLFYVCYRLSGFGWNVMPTARNAKGVDLIAYSPDARSVITVQVKALSGRNPVPLGNRVDNLIGDFFIVCRNVFTNPECFVLLPEEVPTLAHRGSKDGTISYWLQPKQYEVPKFREAWDRINGTGTLPGQGPIEGGDPSAEKAREGVVRVLGKYRTKSEAIRALASEGKERGEIARLLGIRYQHVRNVLVGQPPKTRAS